MRIILWSILSLFLFSCRPYKSSITKPNQMTYQNFRESQQSFTSSQGVIKYLDQGQGDVILLLHGVPTSGWLYRKMIDGLVQAGHRVIVPDMLGFGSSDSPKGYEIYSEEMHGSRLLELMDALQIETWTHVMHDAGGLWTWEMLEQQPHRVKNLVILNTIIYEEGFNPPIRFEPGFMARTVMWSYRNGITTNMMLKGLFSSGLSENTLNKQDVEGYKTPMLEGKTKAMYYFFTQTCNTLPNYKEMIQKIDVPTLVIWGASDSFLKWGPQKEAVMQDLNIQEKNIHIIEAKHFIQEEKPSEINAFIIDFLN